MSVQLQRGAATRPRDSARHFAPSVRAADPLLVSGVSKTWQGKTVLDDVDLSLEPGVLAALVGVNGAGKTTLLRIIAGLIAADSGTVSLDGFDVTRNRREYQRRLGFVSAGQTALYARLSVLNHLEYWARIAFVPRRERRTAIERTIERFDLSELRLQRPDRLSMGQRQRVRLAMGFLHDPRLVLLDEPQTSLDPPGMDVLSRVLEDHVSSGGTVIWCAPTVGDIHPAFEWVCTLAGGRLEVT